MSGSVIDQMGWGDASAGNGTWRGGWEGGTLGATVVHTDKIGDGPRLHKHPYPETFIIRNGHVRFMVGDRTIEATAGQIVVCPADVPHKFDNLGP